MDLSAKAREARLGAYAPYSKFLVGCALECSDGTVYTGVNVENASYGGTVCAERVAIWKAVSEGRRDFRRIAICTASPRPAAPCGLCRQVMSEFCGAELEIILCSADSESSLEKHYRLGELFPEPFDPASLV